MKPAILQLISAALAAVLVGCSALMPKPVLVGDTESDVIAKRGQPTHRYQDGPDHLLEYMRGPYGQQTYMARINSQGKVISFDQVLRKQKFAEIKIGEATKEDVLRTIGAPSETSYLRLAEQEVWSYPYKEDDTWDSMMHVHFDKNGVVRKMLNGPDPRREPDAHFHFGRR